jgi:hypothetical protein
MQTIVALCEGILSECKSPKVLELVMVQVRSEFSTEGLPMLMERFGERACV